MYDVSKILGIPTKNLFLHGYLLFEKVHHHWNIGKFEINITSRKRIKIEEPSYIAYWHPGVIVQYGKELA